MTVSRLDKYIREKEGLESLTRSDIENLQLRKLNEVLKREKARNGFYSGLPKQLGNLRELSALPFTLPSDLTERAGAMLLTSQAEISRVITDSTSGTMGPAKRVFYTPGDCDRTVEFFAAGLSELVFRGGKTMISMPFSGENGLGDLISRAIESLGAEPVKAGVGLSFGQYSQLIRQERPDSFVGMAGQLLSILRFCGRGSIARALVSGDACPKAVLTLIGEFGIELFPHYGSREMALGGAVTCPAHSGMHLRENHVIAEIVGSDGAPLPPGQIGELVITTVGMDAMPLIRYRTGDFTRLLAEKCQCGSELIRLDGVTRKDSSMEALDSALFPLPGLIDYEIGVSGGAVSLRALCDSALSADGLRSAAEGFYPHTRLNISSRLCTPEDRLFYPGKRRIKTT